MAVAAPCGPILTRQNNAWARSHADGDKLGAVLSSPPRKALAPTISVLALSTDMRLCASQPAWASSPYVMARMARRWCCLIPFVARMKLPSLRTMWKLQDGRPFLFSAHERPFGCYELPHGEKCSVGCIWGLYELGIGMLWKKTCWVNWKGVTLMWVEWVRVGLV